MKTVETAAPVRLPRAIGEARNDDVRRAQELLCWAAWRDPATLGACATGVDGEFGPATLAALKAFQKVLVGKVSGVIDLPTWDALLLPLVEMARTPARLGRFGDTVVNAGRAWLKLRPVELEASNKGPVVRFVMTRPERRGIAAGPEGGDWPWCAGAVSTLIALAAEAHDVPAPFPYSWSCPEMGKWAIERGILVRGQNTMEVRARVKPGAIFLCKSASEWHWPHTGIVAAIDGGSMVTLEGNTSAAGSYDGGCFMQRSRAVASNDFIVI